MFERVCQLGVRDYPKLGPLYDPIGCAFAMPEGATNAHLVVCDTKAHAVRVYELSEQPHIVALIRPVRHCCTLLINNFNALILTI